MIEDVQKIFESGIAMRGILQNQLRRGNVEGAKTTGQSQEVDCHFGRRRRSFLKLLVFFALDLGDVTGRKVEFHSRFETDDLFGWIRTLSGCDKPLAVLLCVMRGLLAAVSGMNYLEQSHCLKEVKPVSFGKKPIFESRVLSPTVGH